MVAAFGDIFMVGMVAVGYIAVLTIVLWKRDN